MLRKLSRKMYVRDMKTGRIYDSLRQASEDLGVSTQTIANYCSNRVAEDGRVYDINVKWVTLDEAGIIRK